MEDILHFGGSESAEPVDEYVTDKYGQYAGTYYSQRSYMNEINLGLKKRRVDMEITKDLNSALVIANRKAYNYLYKSLYNEYLTQNEIAQGKGRTVLLADMNKIQGARDKSKTQRFLDIYKTDYIYRTAMYSSNPDVKALLKKEIEEERSFDKTATLQSGRHEDTRQVDVYLTYKINVVNSSATDAIYVSQINDIHSDKMEIIQEEIQKEVQLDPKSRDIEKEGIELANIKKTKIPESAYLKHDKNEEITNLDLSEVDQKKLEKLKWDAKGVHGKERIPDQDAGYIATQTEGNVKNAGFMLNPGQRADIFNTYRVNNGINIQQIKSTDAESLGELKDKVDKKDGILTLTKALELGEFTNTAEIGAFASYNVHTGAYSGKVDRDSAPSNFSTKKQGGKFVLEDDTDDAPGIVIKIPEGKQEETNRELTGVVWEDRQNTLNRGILTGDGKKDENEKGIPGHPVTLEERLSFNAQQIDDKPDLRYAKDDKLNGKTYFDMGFVWPEHIVGTIEDGDNSPSIDMSLKGVTGFESNVKTDENGNYKFTGVPVGNFVVNLNYSGPSPEKLTNEVFSKKENQGRQILNAVANADIDTNDLVHTVTDEGHERKTKWYNGETFKTTQFYANSNQEENIDKTWLTKNKDEDKETQVLSYARDDEGRRIEVTRNLDTFKNNVVDALNVYATENKNEINAEKLKLAHKYTSMNATTPKINFSVEYYEKLNKDKGEAYNSVILNELKDIYFIEGIYKNKENTKLGNTEYAVKNINMGIVQRPESKIVLNKEINNIVITTADGTEKVNLKYDIISKISKAETGNLSDVKYGGREDLFSRLKVEREINKEKSIGEDLVLSLDRTSLTDGKEKDEKIRGTVKSGFRYINIDDSVMQDATIKIRYGIYAYNLSQLDRIINVDDENVKDTNIYREFAYKTGVPDESGPTLGRLKHQKEDEYKYGRYVGREYYIKGKDQHQLTEEEQAKINIRSIMDIVDNGATVNAGDIENMQWVAINKKDLVGLVHNVINEEVAKKAEYIDENGIRYVENVTEEDSPNSNSNTRSNIFLLKESSTEISPVDPDKDIERKYENINGYSNSLESDHFVRTWNIRTDRTASGSSTANDLTFQNMAEVMAYHTTNGRRTEFTPGVMITELDKINETGSGELPGNGEIKESKGKETNLDRASIVAAESTSTSATEIVTLSPPTGLSEARFLEMIRKNTFLIVSVVAVLATSIVALVIYLRKRKASKMQY